MYGSKADSWKLPPNIYDQTYFNICNIINKSTGTYGPYYSKVERDPSTVIGRRLYYPPQYNSNHFCKPEEFARDLQKKYFHGKWRQQQKKKAQTETPGVGQYDIVEVRKYRQNKYPFNCSQRNVRVPVRLKFEAAANKYFPKIVSKKLPISSSFKSADRGLTMKKLKDLISEEERKRHELYYKYLTEEPAVYLTFSEWKKTRRKSVDSHKNDKRDEAKTEKAKIEKAKVEKVKTEKAESATSRETTSSTRSEDKVGSDRSSSRDGSSERILRVNLISSEFDQGEIEKKRKTRTKKKKKIKFDEVVEKLKSLLYNNNRLSKVAFRQLFEMRRPHVPPKQKLRKIPTLNQKIKQKRSIKAKAQKNLYSSPESMRN